MVNEIEEFKAYTGKPVYKCSGKRDLSFLGRFSFEMIMDFIGLNRVLTIIARGYMFRKRRSRYGLCTASSVCVVQYSRQINCRSKGGVAVQN